MTAVLVIGIAPSVTTQTSHSAPNVIDVENLVAPAAETTIDTAMTGAIKTETAKVGASKEMTGAVVETIAGAVEKHTTTMIGTVRNATTQTLHSEPNVIDVENLDQVAADVGHAERVVEGHLDAMTVHEHLEERAVSGHHVAKMAEDHLDEMAVTEEMKAAMEIEVHTVKRDLNEGQRSLERLENLVVMAQVMHTTGLQNQLAGVEKTILEGRQWVPNITT